MLAVLRSLTTMSPAALGIDWGCVWRCSSSLVLVLHDEASSSKLNPLEVEITAALLQQVKRVAARPGMQAACVLAVLVKGRTGWAPAAYPPAAIAGGMGACMMAAGQACPPSLHALQLAACGMRGDVAVLTPHRAQAASMRASLPSALGGGCTLSVADTVEKLQVRWWGGGSLFCSRKAMLVLGVQGVGACYSFPACGSPAHGLRTGCTAHGPSGPGFSVSMAAPQQLACMVKRSARAHTTSLLLRAVLRCADMLCRAERPMWWYSAPL